MLLEEPLPLETARESASFKLEPLETERSPGPRLQKLLGPSPQRDPQAVKERGEEQWAGGWGGGGASGSPLSLQSGARARSGEFQLEDSLCGGRKGSLKAIYMQRRLSQPAECGVLNAGLPLLCPAFLQPLLCLCHLLFSLPSPRQRLGVGH